MAGKLSDTISISDTISTIMDPYNTTYNSTGTRVKKDIRFIDIFYAGEGGWYYTSFFDYQKSPADRPRSTWS